MFFVLWRMCLCHLASRWCYLNWQNFPPPRVVSVQSYWFWDAGVDFEDLGLFLEYLKANIGWRDPYYCRPFWICCWLWENSAWSSKNSSSSNRVQNFPLDSISFLGRCVFQFSQWQANTGTGEKAIPYSWSSCWGLLHSVCWNPFIVLVFPLFYHFLTCC